MIRADASARIGTGHVMRCLALAQAWQDAIGNVVLAMAMESPAIEARLRLEGINVVHLSATPGSDEDAYRTCDLAERENAAFIVVDGYHFNSRYQMLIKGSGRRLLFIDDYGHADRYYADLVLNQNIYSNEGIYKKREPYTRLLLGTSYVLLRREFWTWRGWKRNINKTASKVLVTLGGSDPENFTYKVMRSLQQLDTEGLEVVVLVGGHNPNLDELSHASTDSKIPIKLLQNISNMPELMAWADVAISFGGTTSLELAFMGLPTAVLIQAENQVKVAEQLGKAGVAVNLGWHHDLSSQEIQKALMDLLSNSDNRASMAILGQRLVDGCGVTRLLMGMMGEKIIFRPALEGDCKLIYQWANDAETRAASFSQDQISLKEHIQWYEKKILDANCIFLIAFDSVNRPMGQVRFDLDGKEAVINLSIDIRIRWKALSKLVILRATDDLFGKWEVSRISAFIKPNNVRSTKAFEAAGFKYIGRKLVKAHEALHYVKFSPLSSEEIKDGGI